MKQFQFLEYSKRDSSPFLESKKKKEVKDNNSSKSQSENELRVDEVEWSTFYGGYMFLRVQFTLNTSKLQKKKISSK